MSSFGPRSRNRREKQRLNERESSNSSCREGSEDRADREFAWYPGTSRCGRGNARSAPFRLGKYEIESGRESFRRETMATKGNGPCAGRLQIVGDLAWWRRRLRTEAARLLEEYFRDVAAFGIPESADGANQSGRRAHAG